jgi:glyoxylase-like metal-dependent hydrolase (beta-lactamase superfamily II)
VRLLAELPHPVQLHVTGFGPVVFCHGTPRDDEEVVLVDTRLEKWLEVFAELDADVRTVVCGHTHICHMSAWSTVGWSSTPESPKREEQQ